MSDTRTTCEIDADVAGDVMGWESVDMPISNRRFDSFVGPYDERRGQFIIHNDEVMRRTSHRRWMPWSPSTDIAAAWQVVEKMRPACWTKIGVGLNIETGAELTECSMGLYATESAPSESLSYIRGASAPLAICLAALQVWKSGRALPGGGEPAP